MEPTKSFADSSADAKQIMLKEIHVKWNKFSEQEISSLKNRDDLITQVQAKYSQDRTQVQRDVDSFLKGRPF